MQGLVPMGPIERRDRVRNLAMLYLALGEAGLAEHLAPEVESLAGYLAALFVGPGAHSRRVDPRPEGPTRAALLQEARRRY